MRGSFLCFILLVVLLQIPDFGESKPQDHCECHYIAAKKGCIISRGSSQVGYKCQCRVSTFFWTHCIGTKIQCNAGENCPSGCTSKECCSQAGGDCNGY